MKNRTIIIGLIVIFILMSLVVPSYAEDSRELIVGEEVTLNENIYNTSGLRVDADVLWYSSKPSIISVDKGIIEALKVGEAEVVVSYLSEGLTQEKRVKYIVKPSVKGLNLNFNRPLKVGETINLFELVDNIELNKENYLKHLEFTSENNQLKIEDNKLTAESSGIGRVLVKTKDGSLRKTIDITVLSTVESIAFDRNNLLLKVGEVIEPSVVFQPSNAFLKDYALVSGNPNIIKVDEKKIIGVKSGTTRLTAISKDGLKKATININVSSMVRGIELIEDQIILTDENNSAQLNYILRPKDEVEGIYNKEVVFTTTSPNIHVSSDGVVTASDTDYAQVMVRTKDGNYTDFVRVISRVTPKKTVASQKERPEDIHLVNEKSEVYVGEKVPLNYTFEPAGTSVDLLRFFVDDEYNKNIVEEDGQFYYIPSKAGRRLVEVKGPLGLYSHTNYQVKDSIKDFKIKYHGPVDYKNNPTLKVGQEFKLDYDLDLIDEAFDQGDQLVRWFVVGDRAEISEDGTIKVLKPGNFTVKGITIDNRKSDQILIQGVPASKEIDVRSPLYFETGMFHEVPVSVDLTDDLTYSIQQVYLKSKWLKYEYLNERSLLDQNELNNRTQHQKRYSLMKYLSESSLSEYVNITKLQQAITNRAFDPIEVVNIKDNMIKANVDGYAIVKIRSEQNKVEKNVIIYFNSPKRTIKIYDATNDFLIE